MKDAITDKLNRKTFLVAFVGLAVLGGGTAAVMEYFADSSGTADVQQAVTIDGATGVASPSIFDTTYDKVVASETTYSVADVRNYQDRPYPVTYNSDMEVDTDSDQTYEKTLGSDTTGSQVTWSDNSNDWVRTTYANYFEDAGATHDSSNYESPTDSNAEVVVDASSGSDDGSSPYATIQAGIDAASSGDTVLVKGGDYSSEWVSVDNGVTVVSDNLHGATAGRFTVKSSDVTIKGFEVVGDGADYNGISVEPDNGADTNVVIEDNYIHDIHHTDGSKKDTIGVMVWSYGSSGVPVKDLTIRNNVIEDIGSDSNNGQGFGIFVEDIAESSSYDGVTIENNNISNIHSATINGDNYPGVGVSILPELTNPTLSTSDNKVVTDNANANVTQNVLNTTVDLSLAGDTAQFSSSQNRFLGEINVLTQGNDPNKGTLGITELDSNSVEDVSTGTADLTDNFFAEGLWSKADMTNVQEDGDVSTSFQTLEELSEADNRSENDPSHAQLGIVNEFNTQLAGSDSYKLTTRMK